MEPLSSDILALSLTSSELEARYNKSKHAIELLSKDEDIRRLRAGLFVAEDDAEEIRDQLHHEQESSERTRKLVEQHLIRAQDAEAALASVEQDHMQREHEIQRLNTELHSYKESSHDASALLVEKLALTRELSLLRPELEHFRAQEIISERLRSDTLRLQRELSETQCQLESARAEVKRAQAKRRNTTVEIAQEEQVADLRKELARERRLRINAEEMVNQAQAGEKVDDTRRKLLQEQKLREKLEQDIEDMKGSTELEEIRRELSKAQKAKLRLQAELERVQEQLEDERQTAHGSRKDAPEDTSPFERERSLRLAAEQAVKIREEQLELEKSQLEDKLNQFRSKLREKKEELKTTKEELAVTKERVEAVTKEATDLAPVKELIKKTAASKRHVSIQPAADETTLGTPGDKPKLVRGRQVKAAAMGEKSSFSITPFLNKTAVLDLDQAESPMIDASPTGKKHNDKIPLSPAASIKGNGRLNKPAQSLDKVELPVVVEENEVTSQRPLMDMDVGQVTNAQPNIVPPKPVMKRKQKPRKSLTDFKSFQKEDEPVKQKKRRLGLAPTLFDEDDAQSDAKGGVNSSSLFGPSMYAKLATSKKTPASRSSAFGRSTLLTAADGSGFQFSPLKRARRNLDDTIRA